VENDADAGEAARRGQRALEREGLLGGSVVLVVLFGSTVKGKARPDSDIDVGVLGRGFWDQLAIGTAIGSALGREAHVVDLADASEHLRFEVARTGVLVCESEPGSWTSFKANAMLRYWDLAPMIARTTEGARARLLREARERQEKPTRG